MNSDEKKPQEKKPKEKKPKEKKPKEKPSVRSLDHPKADAISSIPLIPSMRNRLSFTHDA